MFDLVDNPFDIVYADDFFKVDKGDLQGIVVFDCELELNKSLRILGFGVYFQDGNLALSQYVDNLIEKIAPVETADLDIHVELVVERLGIVPVDRNKPSFYLRILDIGAAGPVDLYPLPF